LIGVSYMIWKNNQNSSTLLISCLLSQITTSSNYYHQMHNNIYQQRINDKEEKTSTNKVHFKMKWLQQKENMNKTKLKHIIRQSLLLNGIG